MSMKFSEFKNTNIYKQAKEIELFVYQSDEVGHKYTEISPDSKELDSMTAEHCNISGSLLQVSLKA